MVVQGTDCLFELNTGGGYLPFVCAKSFNLSLNTETVEITSPIDGYWKDFDYDSLSYQIELSGLLSLASDGNIRTFDLMELQMGFVEVLWRAIFEDADGNTKVCTGTALVNSTSLSVSAGSMVDTPISLVGKGPYTVGDTTEICEAAIGTGPLDLVIFPGMSPNHMEVNVNATTGGPMGFDWSIDGGPVNTTFAFNWGTGELTPGSHTIQIWAICVNGIRGAVRVEDFTV